MANKTFKTLLQVGDAATPELFTTVAEVYNIQMPDAVAKEVETTSHDSTKAEHLLTYVDEGEISFDANRSTSTSHTTVRNLLGSTSRNFQVCYPNWGKRTVNFTANDGTDVISATAHALTTGQPVQVSSSGTLPGGLSASTTYFVIYATTDTIKLATTNANAVAGTAIDITSTGSGTHTLQIGSRYSAAMLVKSNKQGDATLDGKQTESWKLRITGAATLS